MLKRFFRNRWAGPEPECPGREPDPPITSPWRKAREKEQGPGGSQERGEGGKGSSEKLNKKHATNFPSTYQKRKAQTKSTTRRERKTREKNHEVSPRGKIPARKHGKERMQ